MTELGGPYLALAVFCENVIEDKHGVLSIIRVIDRTIVTATGSGAPETMPAFPMNATMVLAFKSGFAKGSHRIKIRPVNPDGKPLPEVVVPLHLEGDDRGQSLVLPFRMVLAQEGLYWFEIFVGDALVTRMPFRVIYQPVSIQS